MPRPPSRNGGMAPGPARARRWRGCEVVVRPGLPPTDSQLPARAGGRPRGDGTHSPAYRKLLVGSVAEAVLRTARFGVIVVLKRWTAPIAALPPHDPVRRQPARGKPGVASFAAELALTHSARLILQHVIRPQSAWKCWPAAPRPGGGRSARADSPTEEHDCRTDDRGAGDPTRNALPGRAQQADRLCWARGRIGLCRITRHGVVTGAGSRALPVITLSRWCGECACMRIRRIRLKCIWWRF